MKKFSCKTILMLAGLVLGLATTDSVQATSYMVVEGDSMFSIAEQYGINPYQLAETNDMDIHGLIIPGQILEIPSIHQVEEVAISEATNVGHLEYIVQEGDSFYGIAATFSLDIHDLLTQNQLTLETTIHPGQVLYLTQTVWNRTADASRSDYLHL